MASAGDLVRRRNVAMFGLSANPPTGDTGHVGIVRSLVASGQFVEIWVMPVYVHIYEAKRNLVSYEHRMEMCRLAMEGESTATCTVKVTDTEKDVYEWCCKNRENRNTVVRVGSIDVLSHIQRKHPDIDLHLVLGADTFTDLAAGKWKDSNRIFELATVHVLPRVGGPAIKSDKPFRLVEWVDGTDCDLSLIGTSSTVVRSLKAYPYWPLSRRHNPWLSAYLHPAVVGYMAEHGLYMFSEDMQLRHKKHLVVMGIVHSLAAMFILASAQR